MAEFTGFNGFKVKDEMARNIAKGRNQAVAYSNYAEMVETLNAMEKDEFKVGQNIYIGTVGVPDLWVYSVEPIVHNFTYESDEGIVEMLNNNVTIQCGYYKLAMLEGQKVDLTKINERLDECFQSVSDGKELIASAITDKKVPTDADATFAEMAANIESLKLGSGNATAADVLKGKTFTNDDGVEYTGNMTNNAGTTKSATCSLNTTNKRVQLTVPANAYYSTASKLYDTYANVASKIGLTAAKLVSGNTVLGIAGTAKAFPSSCTVLLSTTTQYSSSKAFSNCPVGVIMMIDVYGYSGTVTVSGMTVIKQTNSNIAQYNTSFVVGVTKSSTVTVKATSFFLEYVAYLS